MNKGLKFELLSKNPMLLSPNHRSKLVCARPLYFSLHQLQLVVAILT